MYLVQLLLPLYDESGARFPASHFADVRAELTERFGGLTAYSRAPAEGMWKDGEAGTTRDDIVVHEVMVEELDRAWWREYRAVLEKRFAQDEILMRAQKVERL